MSNSVTVRATVGVNAGYNHNNENTAIELLDYLAHRYENVARQEEQDGGLYISAMLTPCRVVYKQEWGCPENGEECVEVSMTYNPTFATWSKYPVEEWIASAKNIICEFARALDQSTVNIAVDRKVDTEYCRLKE